MCSSILAITFGLIRHNKCRSNYGLSDDVLKLIGTLAAYSTGNLHDAKTDNGENYVQGGIFSLQFQSRCLA